MIEEFLHSLKIRSFLVKIDKNLIKFLMQKKAQETLKIHALEYKTLQY